MIKVKNCFSSALNRAKAELKFISSSFALQQRRQQAFKRFTQREFSEFKLISELSSTTISNNQSSVRKSSQRDDQRAERKECVEDVSKVITSVFQI